MIVRYTPSESIPKQPQDVFLQSGRTFQQWRDGVLVHTHELSVMVRAVVEAPEFVGSGDSVSVFYVEERSPMDPVTTVLLDVELAGENYGFQFPDGGQNRTLEQLDLLLAKYQNLEFLQEFVMAMSYAHSNGGANMAAMVGRSFTSALAADSPITISE